MKLSILEQSMVSEGQTAEHTLHKTLEMAQLADELGFERFWVAEHHGSDRLASSTPEILMAHIASQTERIRVGSGGVMLPHYSAYKVAENMKLLAALYPGRIDAGMGRAPGGSQLVHYALREGNPRRTDVFPDQIRELRSYLNDEPVGAKMHPSLYAAPRVSTPPEVWMLGSSPSSALLAAEQGLPYMYAQFISGDERVGTEATALYHQRYNRAGQYDTPRNAVSIFFACADTEEEAERIAQAFDYSMLWLETGKTSNGTPSPETIAAYEPSIGEIARMKTNRSRIIVGTPQTAKAQIEVLARAYAADEVMLAMIAYDYDDKLTAYRLIAEAML